MGFLSWTDDDDSRISQMAGTTAVPAPGALQGLLTAIPKGLASAGDKLGSLAEDTLQGTPLDENYHAFRQLVDESNQNMQTLGLPETVPVFDQVTRAKSAAAAQVVAEWGASGQDPRQTGAVGRVVSGTAENVTIGGAGAAVAGPWGAAALLGSTGAHSTFLEAKQNGLDDNTAMEQAGVAGIFSAASAFVPMKFGKTLAQSIIGGSATSIGLGAAQRYATSTVLKANGYDSQANQYRVFDGEAIASDAILGAAFGTMGHYTHGAVNPADVDAASAVSTEEHFNRSAPGVPTDPTAANAHAETMADSLTRMADGDLPDVQPDVAQKIMDGVIPDPIHEVDASLHEAAMEDLPGYEEAIAEVDRQELPAEQLAPWRQRAASVATAIHGAGTALGMLFPPAHALEFVGHIAHEMIDPSEFAQSERRALPEDTAPPARDTSSDDVLLDDFHQQMLDHLVHNNGSSTYLADDGREITYRQMANEMQQQRNASDKYSRVFDAVASCAARNGA
ncbi:hypothetical protein [Rhodanobacter sp. L36]|uniref:hypothetical protein n=1 Tax=Rhodanobacter sp. L36 TaxID=1747221 RepID=UPI00131E5BAC|nr:hypothetical protein [Rhodanobacter sp. L36]